MRGVLVATTVSASDMRDSPQTGQRCSEAGASRLHLEQNISLIDETAEDPMITRGESQNALNSESVGQSHSLQESDELCVRAETLEVRKPSDKRQALPFPVLVRALEPSQRVRLVARSRVRARHVNGFDVS